MDPMTRHLLDALEEAETADRDYREATGAIGEPWSQDLIDASRMLLAHLGETARTEEEAVFAARERRDEIEELEWRKPIDLPMRKAG